MNDAEPEWMKGFVPVPAAGNPNWKRGGPSPNAAGRPVGAATSKRDQMARALSNDGPAVVRAVIDAALAGDMTAAGLVLSRLTPPVKAQAERVQFAFDPSLPIAGQIEQVLAAISSGELPSDIGQQIIAAIGTLSNVRATAELEQRLTLLEAKAVN